MKSLLLWSLLIIPCLAIAQEQIQSGNTNTEKIADARRNLIDYFLEDNQPKVAEYFNLLCNKLESDDYLSLYPEEKWFIYIYLHEYDSLVANILDYDNRNLNKITPEPDTLYDVLLDKASKQKDKIINEAVSMGISGEITDFIPIIFDYCFLGTRVQVSDQDMINMSAKEYVNKHPKSPLIRFISNYIHYEMILKPWSFGFDLGGSINYLSGNIYNTFSHQGGLSLGIEGSYKKFTCFLRANFDFGKTRDTIQFSDFTWENDKLANNILFELSLSYRININKKLSFLPFAGIGSVSLSPENPYKTDDNPDASNPYSLDAFCWVAGLNFDYCPWEPLFTQTTDTKSQKTSLCIRCRYSLYSTEFTGNKKLYDGYVHNISVCVFGLIEYFNRSVL